MTISEAISFLKKSGCRSSFSGNRMTISNIPNWKTYEIVSQLADKLALVAMAKSIFNSPLLPVPFEPGKDRACGFCIHALSKRCPYRDCEKHKPKLIDKNGCEIFVKGEHVYF